MRFTTYAIFSLLVSSSLLAHPIGRVLCAQNPNFAELELAIFQDRNPGFVNKYGESYLHIAAKRNMGRAIARLMKLPQIQALFWAHNFKRQTAMEVAIIGNKEAAFVALLPFMGDPNRFRVDNKHHWTYLHLAAYYNRAAMASALIKAGHAVNPVDKTGWSPLDTAAYMGATKVQGVLSDRGGRSTMPVDERIRLMTRVKDDVIVHDDPAPNAIAPILGSPRAEGAAIYPATAHVRQDHPELGDDDSDDALGADFLFLPEMKVMAAFCATAGAAYAFRGLCSLL